MYSPSANCVTLAPENKIKELGITCTQKHKKKYWNNVLVGIYVKLFKLSGTFPFMPVSFVVHKK
jgi:hypothetical protein